MLQGRKVLVVEDEAVTALDVGDAVEAAGGAVVGPTPSTRGALRLLTENAEGVDAAAIDFSLADGEATPLIEALMHAGIPTVIYTGGPIPEELAARFPQLAVVRKPTEASAVTAQLGASLAARA